ncbi:hypothetical protein [Streptomyces sp. NPDC007088]|uniref:hypothetical protein n=1 Tax=Streptomyces sp. NPDC007088 TaxID=3364773 RepID=UPI003698E465
MRERAAAGMSCRLPAVISVVHANKWIEEIPVVKSTKRLSGLGRFIVLGFLVAVPVVGGILTPTPATALAATRTCMPYSPAAA